MWGSYNRSLPGEASSIPLLRGFPWYGVSRIWTCLCRMSLPSLLSLRQHGGWCFVHRLLPRRLVAIRLASGQARCTKGTPLDARDTARNHTIWNARLVLATTGLHLAQFRHRHRPLTQAIDYAELFIYDEAQQEAALGDVAPQGLAPLACRACRVRLRPSPSSNTSRALSLVRRVWRTSSAAQTSEAAASRSCFGWKGEVEAAHDKRYAVSSSKPSGGT